MSRERTIMNEPVAKVRFEGHLHQNDGGQAYTKNYVAVNRNPRVDSADKSQKVYGITVETHIKEDKTIQDDDSYYCKELKTIQTKDSDNNRQNDGYSHSEQPTPAYNKVADGKGMDKADYLKNMHDNHLEDHRTKEQTDKQWLLWVLAGCAFVGFVALAILYAVA